MNLKTLEKELEKLGQKKIDIDFLLSNTITLKEKSMANLDEQSANILWVYQTILEIHKYFITAFNYLKSKKYNEGWVLLERIEINISFLKRHIHLVSKTYKVKFIETVILNLQSLFPYKLFGSNEMLHKEEKCSVCNKIVNIRNHCGHLPGELYMGEMCSREVTKFDFLGLALVENPVNKYSVIFEESQDKDFRDNHQFGNLNYIVSKISSPYDIWRLEISEQLFPYSSVKITNPNDLCPCGDPIPYKECCLLRGGIQGFHYQFSISSRKQKQKKGKR